MNTDNCMPIFILVIINTGKKLKISRRSFETTFTNNTCLAFQSLCRIYVKRLIMLQLHWSESDVAWNGYLDSPVVCLHWSESDFAWKLGCNPFWSDVTSDVSLSLSLQYNCTLKMREWILSYFRDFRNVNAGC